MHPTNVLSQRADRELCRTPHLVWKARAIDRVEKLIDVSGRRAIQDSADLVDAIQSMLPETFDRLVGIFERWTVHRIQRGGSEPLQALQRFEIVGYTSGVLRHPGRVSGSQ